MFYWCWVSVGTSIKEQRKLVASFASITLFLYYFWHFAFWIFSLGVLIAAAWILRGHLAASSETRKFVLKQNFIYVLVLGIETALIMPIWIAQLTVVKKRIVATLSRTNPDGNTYYPFYFTYTDLGLAIAFAVIHSLRGTVDFLVWLGTFTIGCSDFKDLHYRFKKKFSKHRQQLIPPQRYSPLIKKDSAVNRALRKNTMYCINIGILDAVKLHMEHQGRVGRVGSVRESFVAAAMMQFDEEIQATDKAL